MAVTGRCLCKDVSFLVDGPMRWQVYCHCESCRRNCSAPVTAFFGADRGDFRWTGVQPASYASSPGVKRLFCGRCGTPMAFDAESDTRNIHLYAASLDAPAQYQATAHVFHAERLAWLEISDDLPKHPGTMDS